MTARKKGEDLLFKENYERMISPVKKLLAGVKKQDLDAPDEQAAQLAFRGQATQARTRGEEAPQTGPVKFTQVDSTQVKSTQVSSQVEIESNYTKVDNDILDRAIMTLTPAEFIVYLRLYRLSYGFRTNTCRVGRGRLLKTCNIRSDKTIQVALTGLEMKGFIKPVEGKGNHPAGTLYRVFLPQEIENFDSATRVKFTQVDSTQVKSTQVSSQSNSSKNYLSSADAYNKNNILKEIEKTSSSKKAPDDVQAPDTVRAIYEQLTGNRWNKNDTAAYQKIKDVPLDKIEQGIRLATQRAASRPNSLNYFVREILSLAKPSEQSKSQRKKALEKIVQRVREIHVGQANYTFPDFLEDVKRACSSEGLPFDNDLFNEILGL